MNYLKKKYLRFALVNLVFMMLFILSSCKHDPDIYIENKPDISNICDPDTVYFQNEILPLFLSNCTSSGCHNTVDAEDGVVLIDYASIIRFGGINFEQAQESDIYEVLSDNEERMPPPPAPEFTSLQKSNILKWIQQGALNNQCAQAECDTLNVSYSSSIVPIMQLHCYGCHNEIDQNAGINLKDFQTVLTLVESGKLMGTINHESGFVAMPQNADKLSDCEISKLNVWINNGYENN